MGGMGTWSHAVTTPEKWAAIVPICGRGDPSKADKIKDLPCWAFHGDADTAVNVSGSRDMIEAIKKAGGSPSTRVQGRGPQFVGQGVRDGRTVRPGCWSNRRSNGWRFRRRLIWNRWSST